MAKKKRAFRNPKWLWDNRDRPHIETFLILLYTGMRMNELLLLTVSQVNLEEWYMVWGSKTSRGKDRVIKQSTRYNEKRKNRR